MNESADVYPTEWINKWWKIYSNFLYTRSHFLLEYLNKKVEWPLLKSYISFKNIFFQNNKFIQINDQFNSKFSPMLYLYTTQFRIRAAIEKENQFFSIKICFFSAGKKRWYKIVDLSRLPSHFTSPRTTGGGALSACNIWISLEIIRVFNKWWLGASM